MFDAEYGKSSGIDGFPCEFYKEMWDTIGDDFWYLTFKPFPKVLFKPLNQGLIEITPKNAIRDTVGGWC